ncbi:hypothetical protein GCM10009559_60820 [Pseudonocardia zijingensis]|uniref:Uncharacterized protein n=1 Tax=Pseudonocardia zijingensis TaxID=153376 RepID=A0ABN1N9B1_9PSEU
MRVVRTAPNARIGLDTVFCFDLDGPRLSARYGSGAVAQGWLVGVLDPATSKTRFHYLQVSVDGSVEAGESIAELARSEDGRWQLTEHFTWSSGEGSGTNHLQEASADCPRPRACSRMPTRGVQSRYPRHRWRWESVEPAEFRRLGSIWGAAVRR